MLAGAVLAGRRAGTLYRKRREEFNRRVTPGELRELDILNFHILGEERTGE